MRYNAIMTREEFKKSAIGILLNGEFDGYTGLFDSDNISDYNIVQWDEEDGVVMADIPLEEFLDKLYMVILGED